MAGTRRSFVQWLCLALLLVLVPLGARAEGPGSRGDQFWDPERGESGTVEIIISLPVQRAFVYRGGTLIGVSAVSGGKEGHETPLGRFRILQKRREHVSNRYDNAPMPFMQRLTWTGVALHGGHVPDHHASRGCVRFPIAFARRLYAITQLGDTVIILDEPLEAETALEEARAGV